MNALFDTSVVESLDAEQVEVLKDSWENGNGEHSQLDSNKMSRQAPLGVVEHDSGEGNASKFTPVTVVTCNLYIWNE